MPTFRKHFVIEGAVEITADDAKHAQELLSRFTKADWAEHGELDSYDIEELPAYETEAALADRHWDNVKEAELEADSVS